MGIYDAYMQTASLPSMEGGTPASGFGGRLYEIMQRSPAVWTTLGASLLAGPPPSTQKQGPMASLAGGFRNFAANAPVAYAADAKSAMERQKVDAAEADKAQMRDAWNAVLRAKSTGQPVPPEAQALIASANPTVAAKLFENATGIGATTPKTSLVPIWGEDAQGNPALVQPTDTGEAVLTQMPPGFVPSKGIDKIDAGTEWLLIDKQSGNVVGRQPKDIAGAKREEEIGKQQGEAIADLPTAIGKADAALKTIDQLRNHPGRKGGVGMSAWQAWIPGTPEYDFSVQLKQAQGQVFLSAYQDLKGGGQITEIEGQKAEQAIARLDNWQSEEAFNSALNDLEEVIRAGLKRAQERAGGQAPQPEASKPSGPAPVYTSPSGVKVFAE